MNLLITGGAGFLGYHLANELSHKFDKIIVLDIASIDKSEYPRNSKYLRIDVRDLSKLNKAFKDIDFVIHAAAALPLWKKRDIFDININGTRNVLEAAKNNDVKRTIYVSSTAVYGVPEKHPIYENDKLIGVGSYGESKIEAEKLCNGYRNELCIPIVRPKTFIGTGRLGVFQILYDWVKCGKKIPIIGSGKNHYQLLEVSDLVDAIYLLLTSKNDINDTFNVGATKFNTVLEDVTNLCNFAGTGARVMPTPARPVKSALILFEKLRLSPLYKWVYGTAATDSFVSVKKIEELGWTPKYSNSDALTRSYKWWVEHCDELHKTGITHRVAWRQGILGVFKKFL